MPSLRVQTVELPREVKRTLATELTETIVEARHLSSAERDACVVLFDLRAGDDLAVGGKLVAHGRAPQVELTYRDHALGTREKAKLARRLTETVARALAMDGPELQRITFVFSRLDDGDHAIGGVLRRRAARAARATLARAWRAARMRLKGMFRRQQPPGAQLPPPTASAAAPAPAPPIGASAGPTG
jgi:phenylpyruvate tautomerase PptA (4-oxalocrotonate tautomerase family)